MPHFLLVLLIIWHLLALSTLKRKKKLPKVICTLSIYSIVGQCKRIYIVTVLLGRTDEFFIFCISYNFFRVNKSCNVNKSIVGRWCILF